MLYPIGALHSGQVALLPALLPAQQYGCRAVAAVGKREVSDSLGNKLVRYFIRP